MSESESQFDNFTPDHPVVAHLVGEDPVDPDWPIVNVTNVSPYANPVTDNKVPIPWWMLLVLLCLSAMDLGLLFGLIVIW